MTHTKAQRILAATWLVKLARLGIKTGYEVTRLKAIAGKFANKPLNVLKGYAKQLQALALANLATQLNQYYFTTRVITQLNTEITRI